MVYARGDQPRRYRPARDPLGPPRRVHDRSHTRMQLGDRGRRTRGRRANGRPAGAHTYRAVRETAPRHRRPSPKVEDDDTTHAPMATVRKLRRIGRPWTTRGAVAGGRVVRRGGYRY